MKIKIHCKYVMALFVSGATMSVSHSPVKPVPVPAPDPAPQRNFATDKKSGHRPMVITWAWTWDGPMFTVHHGEASHHDLNQGLSALPRSWSVIGHLFPILSPYWSKLTISSNLTSTTEILTRDKRNNNHSFLFMGHLVS